VNLLLETSLVEEPVDVGEVIFHPSSPLLAIISPTCSALHPWLLSTSCLLIARMRSAGSFGGLPLLGPWFILQPFNPFLKVSIEPVRGPRPASVKLLFSHAGGYGAVSFDPEYEENPLLHL
jgi:hypothetical protein